MSDKTVREELADDPRVTTAAITSLPGGVTVTGAHSAVGYVASSSD